MITVIGGKRPKTFLVGEVDSAKAIEMLMSEVGSSALPINPLPISADLLDDHGVGAGQVKLLRYL